MSKYKYQKQFMFSQKKVDQVRLFLKDADKLDISQIRDDKKNTVLHQCSFQGSLPVMKQYIEFTIRFWKRNLINSNVQMQKELYNWVNQKNKDGFTSLHYAAYKGWIQILEYLETIGADFHIKTNSGLNVFHLAAQTDKVKTLIYYRQRIDLNIRDDKQSTPLHWAAFSGSEKVTQYLLSQSSILIDCVDRQGQSALHLATANGNTKIVRRLLIAGANRHILNHESQQPIAIARQNQFTNIQNFLNDNYTCLDYVKFFLNIKIKYTPKKRSIKMPLIFTIAYVLVVGFLTFAIKFQEDLVGVFYAQEALFFVVFALYLSLIVGRKRVKPASYQSILRHNHLKQSSIISSQIGGSQSSSNLSSSRKQPCDIGKICLRCVQYKPWRSYHCDTCNTCIAQYDHHCPWINNCVGKHNIFRFIAFLLLILVSLSWIFFVDVQLVLMELGYEGVGNLFFVHQDIKQTILAYSFEVITILLYLFFIVPLIVLIVVQILNILFGKTTYQRFSKANQSILSRSQKSFMANNSGRQVRKKDQFSCKNCFQMCLTTDSELQRLLQ